MIGYSFIAAASPHSAAAQLSRPRKKAHVPSAAKIQWTSSAPPTP